MNRKGQGSLEYLLLIGGAVLVAAVVISVVSNLASPGTAAAQSRGNDAICAALSDAQCGVLDPDGPNGSFVPGNCTLANGRCTYIAVTP